MTVIFIQLIVVEGILHFCEIRLLEEQSNFENISSDDRFSLLKSKWSEIWRSFDFVMLLCHLGSPQI